MDLQPQTQTQTQTKPSAYRGRGRGGPPHTNTNARGHPHPRNYNKHWTPANFAAGPSPGGGGRGGVGRGNASRGGLGRGKFGNVTLRVNHNSGPQQQQMHEPHKMDNVPPAQHRVQEGVGSENQHWEEYQEGEGHYEMGDDEMGGGDDENEDEEGDDDDDDDKGFPMIHEPELDTPEEREKLYQELVKSREQERKTAIATGKMDDPLVPKRLEDAITMVGTCMDMCPRFERYRRERENNLFEWECIPGTKRVDHNRAVKMYERAVGDKTIPSDLRPPKVLKRTLNYLFHDLLSRGGFAATCSFIRDRTRAVRNDFTMQHIKGPMAIECHDRCARFHILALHFMRVPKDKAGGKAGGFSVALEEQQLMNTLQSLKEFYEDYYTNNPSSNSNLNPIPTELEMRVYHRLIHIRDQRERHEVIPSHISGHPVFKLVNEFRKEVQTASAPITKTSALVVGEGGMRVWGALIEELNKGGMINKSRTRKGKTETGGRGMVYLVACILEHLFGGEVVDDIESIRGELGVVEIIDGVDELGESVAMSKGGKKKSQVQEMQVQEEGGEVNDLELEYVDEPKQVQDQEQEERQHQYQPVQSAFGNIITQPNVFGGSIFGNTTTTTPSVFGNGDVFSSAKMLANASPLGVDSTSVGVSPSSFDVHPSPQGQQQQRRKRSLAGPPTEETTTTTTTNGFGLNATASETGSVFGLQFGIPSTSTPQPQQVQPAQVPVSTQSRPRPLSNQPTQPTSVFGGISSSPSPFTGISSLTSTPVSSTLNQSLNLTASPFTPTHVPSPAPAATTPAMPIEKTHTKITAQAQRPLLFSSPRLPPSSTISVGVPSMSSATPNAGARLVAPPLLKINTNTSSGSSTSATSAVSTGTGGDGQPKNQIQTPTQAQTQVSLRQLDSPKAPPPMPRKQPISLPSTPTTMSAQPMNPLLGHIRNSLGQQGMSAFFNAGMGSSSPSRERSWEVLSPLVVNSPTATGGSRGLQLNNFSPVGTPRKDKEWERSGLGVSASASASVSPTKPSASTSTITNVDTTPKALSSGSGSGTVGLTVHYVNEGKAPTTAYTPDEVAELKSQALDFAKRSLVVRNALRKWLKRAGERAEYLEARRRADEYRDKVRLGKSLNGKERASPGRGGIVLSRSLNGHGHGHADDDLDTSSLSNSWNASTSTSLSYSHARQTPTKSTLRQKSKSKRISAEYRPPRTDEGLARRLRENHDEHERRWKVGSFLEVVKRAVGHVRADWEGGNRGRIGLGVDGKINGNGRGGLSNSNDSPVNTNGSTMFIAPTVNGNNTNIKADTDISVPFPWSWSLWLSLNPDSDATAIWLECKFDMPNSGGWVGESVFEVPLAGKVEEVKEKKYPGLIVFECSPLGEVRDELERKYKILDDCSRLREVMETLPNERYYTPSLLIITWADDPGFGSSKELQPAQQQEAGEFFNMVQTLASSNVVSSYTFFPITFTPATAGTSTPSSTKDLDANLFGHLSSLNIDTYGQRVKMLDVQGAFKAFEKTFGMWVVEWVEGCAGTGVLGGGSHRNGAVAGVKRFNWPLYAQVVMVAVRLVNAISRGVCQLLGLVLGENENDNGKMKMSTDPSASEPWLLPEFRAIGGMKDRMSAYEEALRYLASLAGVSEEADEDVKVVMMDVAGARDVGQDFPARVFIEHLFELAEARLEQADAAALTNSAMSLTLLTPSNSHPASRSRTKLIPIPLTALSFSLQSFQDDILQPNQLKLVQMYNFTAAHRSPANSKRRTRTYSSSMGEGVSVSEGVNERYSEGWGSPEPGRHMKRQRVEGSVAASEVSTGGIQRMKVENEWDDWDMSFRGEMFASTPMRNNGVSNADMSPTQKSDASLTTEPGDGMEVGRAGEFEGQDGTTPQPELPAVTLEMLRALTRDLKKKYVKS